MERAEQKCLFGCPLDLQSLPLPCFSCCAPTVGWSPCQIAKEKAGESTLAESYLHAKPPREGQQVQGLCPPSRCELTTHNVQLQPHLSAEVPKCHFANAGPVWGQ